MLNDDGVVNAGLLLLQYAKLKQYGFVAKHGKKKQKQFVFEFFLWLFFLLVDNCAHDMKKYMQCVCVCGCMCFVNYNPG